MKYLRHDDNELELELVVLFVKLGVLDRVARSMEYVVDVISNQSDMVLG